jgi:hypothetical protein
MEPNELHPAGEPDSEELAGDPMLDPWEDDGQDDWPTEQVSDG